MRFQLSHIIILFCTSSITNQVCGQAIRNYTVELECKASSISSSQTELRFTWAKRTPAATNQYMYRKSKTSYTWGTSPYKTLLSTDSVFKDTIATGAVFEYMLQKDYTPNGFSAFGYSLSGNRVPAPLYRGKIILIADSTHKTFLDSSLRIFRNDLTGDGWKVILYYVSQSTAVPAVKRLITKEYYADPTNVKAVLLLGHVPVPYSGDFKAAGEFPPDGHVAGISPPSHEGAWPADMYYGDMDTSGWTDASVTNNIGARAANNNNPGDGKFDQTIMPSLLELQVGRIDLANMPQYSLTERELLKQYLKRDHDFKHRVFSVKERGLVDDNFGLVGGVEDFANNAFRNNSPNIGDSVTVSNSVNPGIDYLNTLDTADYLWSYACGAGSYTSVSGVATTTTLSSSTQTLKTVFTSMFGSYLGDWDNTNNVLRAPLASDGYVLASYWAGRPHWFTHHMSLGEPIGYSTLRTQNNYDVIYSAPLYPNVMASVLDIHVALMGDPTVRMQPVHPARSFVAKQHNCNNTVQLHWSKSIDTAVHDYIIMRAGNIDSAFTYLAETSDTFYTDSAALPTSVYMLRATKLQESHSGTYFNLSQGLFDTVTLVSPVLPVANAGSDTSVCPGYTTTVGRKVNSNSINTIYSWSPNTAHTDTTTVTVPSDTSFILIATDTLTTCSDTDTVEISVYTLPVHETLFPGNTGASCNNPTDWSSTLRNGNAFNYTWTFEQGTPASVSGMGLNQFTDIIYDTMGSWLATLVVTNPATNCFNTDSMRVLIGCSPLPVELLYFNCEKGAGNSIVFEWQTASEHNNSVFRIEQVKDALKETVAVIPSKAGISNTVQSYQYILNNGAEASEYNLVQVDLNGQETLLDGCYTLQANKSPAVTLYPNPFSSVLHISGYSSKAPALIRIYNEQGSLVISQQTEAGSVAVNTDNLSPGLYMILISWEMYNFTFKAIRAE